MKMTAEEQRLYNEGLKADAAKKAKTLKWWQKLANKLCEWTGFPWK
jgi:hypothetical protein